MEGAFQGIDSFEYEYDETRDDRGSEKFLDEKTGNRIEDLGCSKYGYDETRDERKSERLLDGITKECISGYRLCQLSIR
jgi:hypothetical protein